MDTDSAPLLVVSGICFAVWLWRAGKSQGFTLSMAPRSTVYVAAQSTHVQVLLPSPILRGFSEPQSGQRHRAGTSIWYFFLSKSGPLRPPTRLDSCGQKHTLSIGFLLLSVRSHPARSQLHIREETCEYPTFGHEFGRPKCEAPWIGILIKVCEPVLQEIFEHAFGSS